MNVRAVAFPRKERVVFEVFVGIDSTESKGHWRLIKDVSLEWVPKDECKIKDALMGLNEVLKCNFEEEYSKYSDEYIADEYRGYSFPQHEEKDFRIYLLSELCPQKDNFFKWARVEERFSEIAADEWVATQTITDIENMEVKKIFKIPLDLSKYYFPTLVALIDKNGWEKDADDYRISIEKQTVYRSLEVGPFVNYQPDGKLRFSSADENCRRSEMDDCLFIYTPNRPGPAKWFVLPFNGVLFEIYPIYHDMFPFDTIEDFAPPSWDVNTRLWVYHTIQYADEFEMSDGIKRMYDRRFFDSVLFGEMSYSFQLAYRAMIRGWKHEVLTGHNNDNELQEIHYCEVRGEHVILIVDKIEHMILRVEYFTLLPGSIVEIRAKIKGKNGDYAIADRTVKLGQMLSDVFRRMVKTGNQSQDNIITKDGVEFCYKVSSTWTISEEKEKLPESHEEKLKKYVLIGPYLYRKGDGKPQSNVYAFRLPNDVVYANEIECWHYADNERRYIAPKNGLLYEVFGNTYAEQAFETLPFWPQQVSLKELISGTSICSSLFAWLPITLNEDYFNRGAVKYSGNPDDGIFSGPFYKYLTFSQKILWWADVNKRVPRLFEHQSKADELTVCEFHKPILRLGSKCLEVVIKRISYTGEFDYGSEITIEGNELDIDTMETKPAVFNYRMSCKIFDGFRYLKENREGFPPVDFGGLEISEIPPF